MQSPACETLTDEIWSRLLTGRADDAPLSSLYGPLLEPPRAPDGCFVLARIAQSLDGCIATDNGDSFWISGAADVLHTHRLRALSDAVVVGAGTVRADDPLLTTRNCPGPSPVRVVIDTDRRLDARHRVFQGGPQTLLACADDSSGPAAVGRASVLRLPRAPTGGVKIAALLAVLSAHGLRRLFVEGGGITISRFLAAGAVDRLHVTVAPLLLGGGVRAFTLPQAARPGDGLRLAWSLHRLADDVLFDIRLDRARPPMCV